MPGTGQTSNAARLSSKKQQQFKCPSFSGDTESSNGLSLSGRTKHMNPQWYNASKWGLFISNFIFWVLGLGLVVVAVWAHLQKDSYDYSPARNVYHVLFNLSYLMMAVGTLTVLVAFMGFVGSLRDNTCLLNSFAVSVLAILFIEAVAASIAAFYSNELKNALLGALTLGTIERYRQDIDIDNFIDWIQLTFQCCGYSSLSAYKDWSNNMYFNCTPTNPSSDRCAVPYSCCITPDNIERNMYNILCGYGVQLLTSAEASQKVISIYMASILKFCILEIVRLSEA